MPEIPEDQVPRVGAVDPGDAPPAASCYYNGLRYSPGARIYAETGEVMECQFNGAWKPTGERKGG